MKTLPLLFALLASVATAGAPLKPDDRVSVPGFKEARVVSVTADALIVTSGRAIKQFKREELPENVVARMPAPPPPKEKPLLPIDEELEVKRTLEIIKNADALNEVTFSFQNFKSKDKWYFRWAITATATVGSSRRHAVDYWGDLEKLDAVFGRFLTIAAEAKPGVPVRHDLGGGYRVHQSDESSTVMFVTDTAQVFSVAEIRALRTLLPSGNEMIDDMAAKIAATLEQRARLKNVDLKSTVLK